MELLPRSIKNKLFGEREKYGQFPFQNDPDWEEWLTFYYKFYSETQKKGISDIVNNSGYKSLRNLHMEGQVVLEIGPGDLPHMKYWLGKPQKYILCDIREDFLRQSSDKLKEISIKTEFLLINSPKLFIPDSSVDIIIAFYVLEHLAPLEEYLNEMLRVLKPNGLLVGGIPTEGGLFWGIGRFFSSRRYILSHSSINPDKIICWEHPNFANLIINTLDSKMKLTKKRYWPFLIPYINWNLIISFSYMKLELGYYE